MLSRRRAPTATEEELKCGVIRQRDFSGVQP